MPELFDTKVHHFDKQRNNVSRLVKTNAYCQMRDANTNAKVFLRHGKAWDAQGKVLSPTPEWCIDRLKESNPIVIKECGFDYLIESEKVNEELPLKERMRVSVEKGIMTQSEYDVMFPKETEADVPRETEVDLSSDGQIEAIAEAVKTVESNRGRKKKIVTKQ